MHLHQALRSSWLRSTQLSVQVFTEGLQLQAIPFTTDGCAKRYERFCKCYRRMGWTWQKIADRYNC